MNNLFFLPPSLGRVEEGQALEDVVFMRDEMASMAWAIERTLENPIERASAIAYDVAPQTTQPLMSTTLPRYVLQSTVPTNWIPLLPVHVQQGDGRVQLTLQRAALLQPDGGPNALNEAHSDALNGRTPLRIYDEEVPREGARVVRSRRLSRWVDGSFWLWTAFRREVGKGEGSSKLKFDQLVSQAPAQVETPPVAPASP
jgi:hypothetical protein